MTFERWENGVTEWDEEHLNQLIDAWSNIFGVTGPNPTRLGKLRIPVMAGNPGSPIAGDLWLNTALGGAAGALSWRDNNGANARLISLAQTPLFNSAANVNTANIATDIVTQTITSVGGVIIIVAFADLFENKSVNNTAALHSYSLRRDTTDLVGPITYATRGFTDALPNSSTNRTIFYKETPGVGTFTYKMRTSYQSLSTNGTPTSNGSILIAELLP